MSFRKSWKFYLVHLVSWRIIFCSEERTSGLSSCPLMIWKQRQFSSLSFPVSASEAFFHLFTLETAYWLMDRFGHHHSHHRHHHSQLVQREDSDTINEPKWNGISKKVSENEMCLHHIHPFPVWKGMSSKCPMIGEHNCFPEIINTSYTRLNPLHVPNVSAPSWLEKFLLKCYLDEIMKG